MWHQVHQLRYSDLIQGEHVHEPSAAMQKNNERLLTSSLMILILFVKGGDSMIKVQVMVTEEMMSRIDSLAKDSGLSRSAFCNMLIADGVRSREVNAKFLDSLPNAFRDMLTNEKVVKVIAENAPTV